MSIAAEPKKGLTLEAVPALGVIVSRVDKRDELIPWANIERVYLGTKAQGEDARTKAIRTAEEGIRARAEEAKKKTAK